MTQNIASLAQNENNEKVIKITFDFNLDMLYKIRSLPGRKYHPTPSPAWSIPFSIEGLEQLQKWNFIPDEKLLYFVNKQKERKAEISINGISGLKGTLRPFQNAGVAFIEDKKGRALIADEMGLGKTIEALAWLQLHRNKIPVIIVVSASLKLNWQREAEKWLSDPNTEILSGTKIHKTKGDIIIINYDILFAWIEELRRRKPQIIIMDESHYIKANKAKRTKATKMLCKNIPHIIALSGTPIINRPIEIYNAIKIIDPDLFPNFVSFTRRYCNAKYNGFGWDFNGASNTEELNHILTTTIMIRRKKSEVLKDLPDKVYSFVPIELNNEKEYREAEKDFIAFVRKEKGQEAANRIENIEALAKIEGLKQLAVKGKLKQSIEWIRDFLESDNKLVVFCTHKFVIEELMTEFKNAVKIDGSVSMTNRQKAVDDFQDRPEVKLFVGNIQAAGVGIALTSASNVVILEFPWTPGALVQCIDRLHRIGQKNSVNVYYLMAKNTIEEKIINMLDSKTKVCDAVLDGTDTPNETLLSELMKLYV